MWVHIFFLNATNVFLLRRSDVLLQYYAAACIGMASVTITTALRALYTEINNVVLFRTYNYFLNRKSVDIIALKHACIYIYIYTLRTLRYEVCLYLIFLFFYFFPR